MRTEEFDKIVRNDFERAKHGPKGKIQDVFCNLSTPTIFLLSAETYVVLMNNETQVIKICACSSLG